MLILNKVKNLNFKTQKIAINLIIISSIISTKRNKNVFSSTRTHNQTQTLQKRIVFDNTETKKKINVTIITLPTQLKKRWQRSINLDKQSSKQKSCVY